MRLLTSTPGQKSVAKKSSERKAFSTLRVVLLLFLLSLVLRGVWIANHYMRQILHAYVEPFFRVKTITIHGCKHTSPEEIRKHIQLKNQNLLRLDLSHVKTELAKLPWVKQVVMQRRFPQTLMIRVIEKEPLAIWKTGKKRYLLDAEGALIPDQTTFPQVFTVYAEKFFLPTLPKLIGQFKNFPSLLEKLERVVIHRYGRFDVTLRGGCCIKLPEKGIKKALQRLSHLIRTTSLDLRTLESINLQQAETVLVRP